MTTSYTSRIGTAPEEGIKSPCVVSTESNINLQGLQTIDTIVLTNKARVLVRSQTNPAENGIWLSSVGEWTRATDFNAPNDVVDGMLIMDSNSGVLYRLLVTGSWDVGVTETSYINTAGPLPDPEANEYCPNYTYVFVDDDTFQIDLFNVVNVFNVTKRLKFARGDETVYGTVVSVDYNVTQPNDTTVNMLMEDSAVLTNEPTEICQVSGTAGWSSIASDPFGGSSINDICTGVIGATQWWFAVGNGGKVGTSNDAGSSWTILTTTTTENLNCCTYDSDNETFWGGGNAGVLLKTSDGVSVIEDTTSVPALSGSGTDNLTGIAYSEVDSALMLSFTDGSTFRTATSVNQGGAWTEYASLTSAPAASSKIVKTSWISSTIRDNYYFAFSGISQSRILVDNLDTNAAIADTVATNITSLGFFWDGVGESRVYGTSNGNIIGINTWTGDDTTTFSTQLNDFAYSAFHQRLVVVGNNSQIGYKDLGDKIVNNAWTPVQNGASPLSNLNAVARNEIDGMYVAVGNTGQILRSVNGVN